MASFDAELLRTAEQLLFRDPQQRGRLPDARVRRSISTAYYAVVHFLIDEAGRTLIGTQNDLQRRRRIFGRVFTHEGMRIAPEKVRSVDVDQGIADFLRPPTASLGPVSSPPFMKNMAAAFSDAQAKGHDADYNLNEPLSELEAKRLIDRVEQAIAGWRAAKTPGDRDYKQNLCMLMLLKGKLRVT